jgi:hypothetical protein
MDTGVGGMGMILVSERQELQKRFAILSLETKLKLFTSDSSGSNFYSNKKINAK